MNSEVDLSLCNRSTSGAPNPIDVHVGNRIRLRRTLLGYSQQFMAKQLGLTFQQVQKYEKGTNRLTVLALMEYADALDVHPSVFFDGDLISTHSCILNPRLIKKNLNMIYKSLSNIEAELTKKQ